jgi:hypothetical protein
MFPSSLLSTAPLAGHLRGYSERTLPGLQRANRSRIVRIWSRLIWPEIWKKAFELPREVGGESSAIEELSGFREG